MGPTFWPLFATVAKVVGKGVSDFGTETDLRDTGFYIIGTSQYAVKFVAPSIHRHCIFPGAES
jgi:hypothetical protein